MRDGESEGRFVKSDERTPRVCVVSSGAGFGVAPFCFLRGYTTSEGGLNENSITTDLSHESVEQVLET
jgi:hypothetical protein